jgi:serine/threonine-protein kinase RsbW
MQYSTGNNNDSKKTCKGFPVKASESYILFTVTDQGKGFDSNNLPDPTLPENISESKWQGHLLMKHLADLSKFSTKTEAKLI